MVQGQSLYAVLFLSLRKIISVKLLPGGLCVKFRDIFTQNICKKIEYIFLSHFNHFPSRGERVFQCLQMLYVNLLNEILS